MHWGNSYDSCGTPYLIWGLQSCMLPYGAFVKRSNGICWSMAPLFSLHSKWVARREKLPTHFGNNGFLPQWLPSHFIHYTGHKGGSQAFMSSNTTERMASIYSIDLYKFSYVLYIIINEINTVSGPPLVIVEIYIL